MYPGCQLARASSMAKPDRHWAGTRDKAQAQRWRQQSCDGRSSAVSTLCCFSRGTDNREHSRWAACVPKKRAATALGGQAPKRCRHHLRMRRRVAAHACSAPRRFSRRCCLPPPPPAAAAHSNHASRLLAPRFQIPCPFGTLLSLQVRLAAQPVIATGILAPGAANEVQRRQA